MKKYLCYDCAAALGYGLEWWNSEDYVDDCANQKHGEAQHKTVAVMIDTGAPPRRRLLRPEPAAPDDFLDSEDIEV